MAIDWREGMNRTYELIRLADDWHELEMVQELAECTVTYERGGLCCSASLVPYSELADGYYRIYMVATQENGRNGLSVERVPLATVRMQSPERAYDGRAQTWKAVGYSPLVELDADCPPLGWTAQGTVVQRAAEIVRGHCHAPCSYPATSATMEAWTAEDGDTWLDCLDAVLAKASMHVEVDGMGTVQFVPDADASMLSPVWVFDDAAYGLPSILMPDVSDATDYYDLANKVEVVHSTAEGCLVGTAVNDDPDSRASTVSRGYVKLLRVTDPDMDEPVTQAKVDAYARRVLAEQGVATHAASFSHAFVPGVKVGRCVRLDYTRFGYRADAVITKQVIECDAGCVVETDVEYEEAVYGS